MVITTTDKTTPLSTNAFSISCIIPSYSVRLSASARFKPLGLAYGIFGNLEDANNAIENLDKFTFKNRKLKARLHVPYTPKIRHMKSVKSASVPEATAEGEGNNNEAAEETTELAENAEQYSNDTVFFKFKGKATEEEIRAFFGDYTVKNVFHVTKKFSGPRRASILRHTPSSYLVALELGEEDSLDTVVENLQTGEFKVKFSLMKAFLEKSEAMKKAHNESEANETAENEPEN